MELTRGIFFLLLTTNLTAAKMSLRRSDNVDKTRISPELEPTSSEKFFKKDYPYDHRPVADPFHFKHPYPVVQDSSEFDKDYVKDENSDNGNWKAQETYDKLRAKLAKEKADVAKAKAKEEEEYQEMQDAMKRHDQQAHDKADADKNLEGKKHEEEEAKKEAAKTDAAPAKGGDVSTSEVEKEMKELEDCKKQLAEAQKKLKELMDELDAAKAKQKAANAAADDALKKELAARETHESMKGKVQEEYDEFQDAQEAYMKQKAEINKLEADIKISAEKVRKMRDSADADGGVYPVNVKSSALSRTWLSATVLLVAVFAASH